MNQQRDPVPGNQLGVDSDLVKPAVLEDVVQLAHEVSAIWLGLNQPPVAGS